MSFPSLTVSQARLNRHRFFRQTTRTGSEAAATLPVTAIPSFAESTTESRQEYEQSKDTVRQIFTAALIAEDLATTFYYNVLTGKVIMDPNLAGAGGTATNTAPNGNLGNVDYVRAALTEEIAHANLFRSLLGIPDPTQDPAQTFYFPAGAFDTVAAVTGLLDALDDAFMGPYLNAIQEFAAGSHLTRHDDTDHGHDDTDSKYRPMPLDYFAKVSASPIGTDREHRVLGRAISNSGPANNLKSEQTEELNAAYNGSASAAAALTPFLTPSFGTPYSLAAALAGAPSLLDTITTGAPPL